MSARDTLGRAGGQCECTGACGENHRLVAGLSPERCKVPDHARILRAIERPTYWVLMPTEVEELAFKERYAPTIIESRLTIVSVDGKEQAFCERCAQAAKRTKEEGRPSRGRRP